MRKLLTYPAALFIISAQAEPNVCYLLKNHPSWYWASLDVQHKWGIPVSEQMAIMREESGFRSHAQTPATKLFGLTLWHQSTAEGFPQALNGTWHHYVLVNHKISANRADFSDATDFMGWYLDSIHNETGISKKDAYHLYLAYHEGPGGYHSRSYLHKPWLMMIARNVSWHANLYHNQIAHCDLPTTRWY